MPDNITNAGNKPCLITLDDVLNEVYSKEVCHLFTKGSHHRNISVTLIKKCFTRRGIEGISLNEKYIVVLKNIRNNNHDTHLARQVYPENSAGLYKAYLDATKKPHVYFESDFSQDTDDKLRFRTTTFLDEVPRTFYSA